jgi:hypothetical protein
VFFHAASGNTGEDLGSDRSVVGHLDPKTTRRHIHFMPKDKRATVESIPCEF